MDEVPGHQKRYPTRAGCDALAFRLGLTINPFSLAEVEELLQPQTVAALLQANLRLHASTIAYWSVFGHDDASEEQFRVSAPMRRVWVAVQPNLGERKGCG